MSLNIETKRAIGVRVREKREQAGYSREKLGEICSLSPRFIANIEFGDSTFSLDSLISICRALSCSCDYLLFGDRINSGAWGEVITKLENLDVRYKDPVDKVIQSVIEAIAKAEQRSISHS